MLRLVKKVLDADQERASDKSNMIRKCTLVDIQQKPSLCVSCPGGARVRFSILPELR